jgi:hypothetical protein
MDGNTEPQAAARNVEELQDFYLSSESRAALARNQLTEMMEHQKQQAELVVQTITRLREQLIASETARLQLANDNRILEENNNFLERELRLVRHNFERLNEGYTAMMSVVENTHTSSINLNQRIDAMLLQHDVSMQGQPPRTAPRLAEFRDQAFGVRPHPNHAVRHSHEAPQPMSHHHPYPAHRHEGF